MMLVLVTLLIVVPLTACNKQTDLVKIRVSEVTHSVFYAPQYAAIALGFFEEEGLEIELINGAGADRVMTAVLSGQVEIGFSGPEAAIYVYNEGREDYATVFAQLTKRDGSFLVGRQSDPNFNWDKLKGKTIIGGRKGGVPLMTLEYVLKKNGLTPGVDVEVLDNIQFAAMAGAFTGGTGDYVTLFEPVAVALEKEKTGYVVASIGAESGEIPYTAYFASNSYIKKNPDTIQKFTNAVYKGQLWVEKSSPEEIAKVIQPFFAETDLEVLTRVAERYKKQDAWSKDPIMTQESFSRLQHVMTLAGELVKEVPHDKLIDNSYAEKAIKNIKK